MYYNTVGTNVGDTQDWVIENLGIEGYKKALDAGLEIRDWKEALEPGVAAHQLRKLTLKVDKGISTAELNNYVLTHEVFALSEIFYRHNMLPSNLKLYNYTDFYIIDTQIEHFSFILVVDKAGGYSSITVEGRHKEYPWAAGGLLKRVIKNVDTSSLSDRAVYGVFYTDKHIRCVDVDDMSVIKLDIL